MTTLEALNGLLKDLKELPTEGVAGDGVRALIAKPEALEIVRCWIKHAQTEIS